MRKKEKGPFLWPEGKHLEEIVIRKGPVLSKVLYVSSSSFIGPKARVFDGHLRGQRCGSM